MNEASFILSNTPNRRGLGAGEIYRLIYEALPGRFDTGATYPDCDQTNPDKIANCQGQQFGTLQDALNYCTQHNEIPVRVTSAQEAYEITQGMRAIDASQVIANPVSAIPSWWWVAGAAALLVFMRRGRR